jgi:hypothetical protein
MALVLVSLLMPVISVLTATTSSMSASRERTLWFLALRPAPLAPLEHTPPRWRPRSVFTAIREVLRQIQALLCARNAMIHTTRALDQAWHSISIKTESSSVSLLNMIWIQNMLLQHRLHPLPRAFLRLNRLLPIPKIQTYPNHPSLRLHPLQPKFPAVFLPIHLPQVLP